MRDLPHKVITSKQVVEQAKRWCEEQFGQRWEATGYRQGRWCVFWGGMRTRIPGSYEWYFQNEQDALMFALRWS
jgi:hypothetical protein